MKKLLLILCLFVSVVNHAQAQTKEETIAWLQEKLQKYVTYSEGNYSENLLVSVTDCLITIKYTRMVHSILKGFTNDGEYFTMFPTANLLFDGEIHMKDDVESIRWGNDDKRYRFINRSIFKIIAGEEKLIERLQKAVDHLATFCPKTKETF